MRSQRTPVRRPANSILFQVLTATIFVIGFGFEALEAQEEQFPGVRLGLTYENVYQPVIAIQPFTGRFGGDRAASEVEGIIGRDLDYSDRFATVLDSLPESMTRSQVVGVDYKLWDELNADWLITGQVEGTGAGFLLILRLHDVVFEEVVEEARVSIPDPGAEGFRMVVHRVSDDVVEWVFAEPGMAASRIAFIMETPGPDGEPVQELYTIDSDGENLRRLTHHNFLVGSPAWAPGGDRIAFTSYKPGQPRIFEFDLASGRETQLETGQRGQFITPAYHPNGEEIAFALLKGAQTGVFTYNFQDDCCLTEITGGRWEDLSPTFSPDGRWMAFNSNRLGYRVPQVYMLPSSGGDAELLSPYVFGQQGYYTSPDWAPNGDRVAYHGRIRRGGLFQILVANVEDRDRKVSQLTFEGNNEDPSWAPDGRHIVFIGDRRQGRGLLVVDAATGEIRPLVTGRVVKVPDWSPALSGN